MQAQRVFRCRGLVERMHLLRTDVETAYVKMGLP